MKKITLLTISFFTLLLSGCVLGGITEAAALEGTWESYDSRNNNKVIYTFTNTSVDVADGDYEGRYTIRFNSPYDPVLEEGYYKVDYILSNITFYSNNSVFSREFDYRIDDNVLILEDQKFWDSTSIYLFKLY